MISHFGHQFYFDCNRLKSHMRKLLKLWQLVAFVITDHSKWVVSLLFVMPICALLCSLGGVHVDVYLSHGVWLNASGVDLWVLPMSYLGFSFTLPVFWMPKFQRFPTCCVLLLPLE